MHSRLSYGVMVAQQFLVLFVVVRIRLGQHNEGFLFIEEAFVVLRRKGENCGGSNVAKEKLWWFESTWDNIRMAFSL